MWKIRWLDTSLCDSLDKAIGKSIDNKSKAWVEQMLNYLVQWLIKIHENLKVFIVILL